MKKGFFILSLMMLLALSVSFSGLANASFSDVSSGSSGYSNAINFLSLRGVVSGYSDGTFRPTSLMNRAELLKIVIGAAERKGLLNISDLDSYYNDSCFTDVDGGQWYTKFVCYAKAKGIVSGYSDGSFRPAQNITSAETYKIMFKAFNVSYASTNPWYVGLIDKMRQDYKIENASDEGSASFLVKREVMANFITRVILKMEGKLDAYVSDGFIEGLSGSSGTPASPSNQNVPATPVPSSAPGNYSTPLNIKLTSVGSTSIHYETDVNSTPSCASLNVYSDAMPIFVATNVVVIKAVGCNSYGSSPMATLTYTLNKSIALNSPSESFSFTPDSFINFSWLPTEMPQDTHYQIYYSCSNGTYPDLDKYKNPIGGTLNGFPLLSGWSGLIQNGSYKQTSFSYSPGFQKQLWSNMDMFCLWKVEGVYSYDDQYMGISFPNFHSSIGHFVLKASLLNGK